MITLAWHIFKQLRTCKGFGLINVTLNYCLPLDLFSGEEITSCGQIEDLQNATNHAPESCTLSVITGLPVDPTCCNATCAQAKLDSATQQCQTDKETCELPSENCSHVKS